MVDSTRCVSYLTIEERGDIPEELRPGLGNRVYGCDVCQDVCPFNHAAAVSGDPAWQARPGLVGATAAELWRTSDSALRRLMKGSAMKHAKLPMVRRNLALALEASGSQDDRAALAEPAEDRPSADDALVRRHIRIKA
jgi:epoxyqueuosine reductase